MNTLRKKKKLGLSEEDEKKNKQKCGTDLEGEE